MDMIPVLTTDQIRKIDEEAIHGDLNIGFEYMSKAARGLYEAITEMIPNKNFGDITVSESIVVVCGKGNNGGDGYLLAKFLINSGYRVRCFSLCDPSELKGEAKKAFTELISTGINVITIKDAQDLNDFTDQIDNAALIVDAILGTGGRGNPKGIYADLINLVNKSNAKVIAVDTPSGMNNDNGQIFSPCIKAHTTIAMGYPKLGAFFYPARNNIGSLMIKDLGYPEKIFDKNFSQIYFLSHEEVSDLLPKRKVAGSKFDHGLAMMLCGSKGMTGSAVLASMAAMRSGAGMVHLLSPESSLDTLASHLIEVVLHGLDETSKGTASSKALEQIMQMSNDMHAICIGPGISHEAETSELVREMVSNLDKPIVLDADGLNAYKARSEELKNHKAELLITPHEGEFKRLFGELPVEPDAKLKQLKAIAKDYNMTILYKGMPTLVVEPSGRSFILPFGNSGMATAGSGDVLSGIITGFVAQGATMVDAAILGAYVHSTAGDLASEELGEHSLMARDILAKIAAAILSFS